jgi:hypothetical protein
MNGALESVAFSSLFFAYRVQWEVLQDSDQYVNSGFFGGGCIILLAVIHDLFQFLGHQAKKTIFAGECVSNQGSVRQQGVIKFIGGVDHSVFVVSESDAFQGSPGRIHLFQDAGF